MTRVLITGARGFVGRHVTATLASEGFEVHGVTTHAALDDPKIATWHRADLLDAAQGRRVVAEVRPDWLVHLAWCAKPPSYWRDPDNIRWTTTSLELLRAFVESGGTRIVAIGTCAEYDWRYGYCVEGITPVAPATLYGASKAAFGSLLESYAAEVGLSAAWARPFFLFGPHDAPERLIPSLVMQLHAGVRARCAAGNHVRDFLFVQDAAEAIVALLKSRVTGAVNVASGTPVRIADVAAAVSARLGRRALLHIEEGSSEHAVVAASVARLRDEVGWRPTRDYEAALDETVRWWTTQRPSGVVA